MTCAVFNVTDKSLVITWGEKEHDVLLNLCNHSLP